jgi:MoxR-like ATPase
VEGEHTASVSDSGSSLQRTAARIVANVERVLLGKRSAVECCLAALLANGHVLIEDVPGVGKTVLACALAISIGAGFTRIQFTPDLLPGNVTGVQVINPESREFEYRPGSSRLGALHRAWPAAPTETDVARVCTPVAPSRKYC